MEIYGVARRDLGRTVIVVVCALIGGAIAALVASGQTRYEVKASVFVSQALPPDATASSLGTFLGDFESAVSLDAVKKGAAEAVGQPVDAFSVEVDRALDASTVSLTVTVPEEAAPSAEEFTRSLSVGALKLLGQQRLEQAVAAEKTARDAATKANDALNRFVADNDTLDPVAESSALTVTLRSLISQKDAPGLTDVAKAALDDRIQKTQAEIDRLEPLRSEYAQLQRAATQSQKLADDLAARRINAETFVDTAVSSTLVATGPAEKVSKLAARLQAGFVGLVVGALIALVVLAAERRLRAGRTARRASATARAGQGSGAPARAAAERGVTQRPVGGTAATRVTPDAEQPAESAEETVNSEAVAADPQEEAVEDEDGPLALVAVDGEELAPGSEPAPIGSSGAQRPSDSDAGGIGKASAASAQKRSADGRRSTARPAKRGTAKRGGGIRPCSPEGGSPRG